MLETPPCCYVMYCLAKESVKIIKYFLLDFCIYIIMCLFSYTPPAMGMIILFLVGVFYVSIYIKFAGCMPQHFTTLFLEIFQCNISLSDV